MPILKPMALLALVLAVGSETSLAFEKVDYEIHLDTVTSGYEGGMCWVHPRAGILPRETPTVILTTQELFVGGSDFYLGLHTFRTENLGKSWEGPIPEPGLARAIHPSGTEAVAADFTPQWHAHSGKLLGTGHTINYEGLKILRNCPIHPVYAVYNEDNERWDPWKILDLPEIPMFYRTGAGCCQRVDLPDGDILLPVYHKGEGEDFSATTVLRCGFDGENLSYEEHGNTLRQDTIRGFAEPSLTEFKGRYYLTIRHNERGYVATSGDGLHFSEPLPWFFDTGEELGSYNTQQHWIATGDGLFLVYTRRGAENDHVFRHRAPLFIAQVDPDTLCVLRETERVLVPERGARLGNFGITDVKDNETWVTVAEWMQPVGIEKYGSDNTIYVAKIRWTP
ncbi:MAG: exo-alpha-sialidase [Candidatus Omnitrophica bacterium]|nr:exo-alpha-sialidase [Candidatus Omnitrophota bacterium]